MSAQADHEDTESRGPRARGRELALVVLCHLESLPDAELAEARHTLLSHPPSGEGPGEDAFASLATDDASRAFADDLLDAWAARRSDVDALLAATSQRWRIDRMDRIDRNLLRLATAELLAPEGTPRGVVLSEAVRLARRYGSDTSVGFVNGVLDAVARRVEAGPPAAEEPSG